MKEADSEDVKFDALLRLRVNNDLKRRLKGCARADRRKTSEWIREQLWRAVDAKETNGAEAVTADPVKNTGGAK